MRLLLIHDRIVLYQRPARWHCIKPWNPFNWPRKGSQLGILSNKQTVTMVNTRRAHNYPKWPCPFCVKAKRCYFPLMVMDGVTCDGVDAPVQKNEIMFLNCFMAIRSEIRWETLTLVKKLMFSQSSMWEGSSHMEVAWNRSYARVLQRP